MVCWLLAIFLLRLTRNTIVKEKLILVLGTKAETLKILINTGLK